MFFISVSCLCHLSCDALSSPASKCQMSNVRILFVPRVELSEGGNLRAAACFSLYQGTYSRVSATCATSPLTTAPWPMMQLIPVWWEKKSAPLSFLLKVTHRQVLHAVHLQPKLLQNPLKADFCRASCHDCEKPG